MPDELDAVLDALEAAVDEQTEFYCDAVEAKLLLDSIGRRPRHFVKPWKEDDETACGSKISVNTRVTNVLSDVTCGGCKKTTAFKSASWALKNARLGGDDG